MIRSQAATPAIARRWLRRISKLLVACVGLLSSACGGDSTPQQASSQPPTVVRPTFDSAPRPAALDRSLRQVVLRGRAGETELPLDRTRANSLDISFGLRRAAGKRKAPVPSNATFEILAIGGDGTRRPLLRSELTLPAGDRETPWQDHRIELDGLGDDSTHLVFKLLSEDPDLVGLWGSPLLHTRVAAAPAPDTPRPPVILISIDTLGTRHMSLYGYERETTPELERLAQDAVVFEQAITQQSWTLTAHASLLTSLYPDSHRVSRGSALAPSLPLLPALLQEAGYATFGLVNNPYLDPRYGYDRGFDIYDFAHLGQDAEGRRLNRNVEQSNEIILGWLRQGLPEPWFLFYHVIDPHSDWRDVFYESPEPFRDRFASTIEGEPPPVPEGSASAFLAAVNNRQESLSPEQILTITADYDAGVAYTDHHIGRFLDHLRQHGLYDPAIIVVTSDHGEEFLQHGRTMHSQGYDECLRVPLLIKLPSSKHAGTRVSTQVQHIDLLPTLFDLLGLTPPPAAEGHSLLPVIVGEPHPQPLTFSKGANYSMRPNDVYVARSDAWKLIWWRKSNQVELYDMIADPLEQNDLSKQKPKQRQELLAALMSHRSERDRGFRLRVPRHAQESPIEIRLTTDGRFIRDQRYDQNGLRESRVQLEKEDSDQTLILTLPEPDSTWRQPIGLDFDLSREATHLTVEAFEGGDPVDPSRLLLGPNADPAQEWPARFGPGSSALRLPPRVTVRVERTTSLPQIYLWESRPAQGAEVNLSERELESLRALGYVDAGQ